MRIGQNDYSDRLLGGYNEEVHWPRARFGLLAGSPSRVVLRFGLGLDLTARASLRKLVLRHAFPMLTRVHRSSSGHTTLIIVETGDPLSTNAVCYASGGEGHDQYKRFHGQRQKFLNRVGDSSV
jgi:hypothetical protein